MNEQVLVSSTGENESVLEMADVGKVIEATLTSVQAACVQAEFSLSNMPTAGAVYGVNKVEVVRQLCGKRLTLESYTSQIVTAMKALRVQFESRGWLRPDSSKAST